jgi:hypothetical protein
LQNALCFFLQLKRGRCFCPLHLPISGLHKAEDPLVSAVVFSLTDRGSFPDKEALRDAPRCCDR